MKEISFAWASQIIKPKCRNLAQGEGAAEIEAAEFRVRNAVARNNHAISLFFDAIVTDTSRKNLFGPFIFAGASGTGKSTFIRAIVSDSAPRYFVEFDLGLCRVAHDSSSIFGAPPGYQGSVALFAKNLAALNEALVASGIHGLRAHRQPRQ